MANGFDVSALSDYTKENSGILVAESIIQAPRTLDMVSVQTGVKASDSINIMDQPITLQSGYCAGGTDGGDSLKFTQRTLDACPITYESKKCWNELEDYWQSQIMKAGSLQDEIPTQDQFNEIYTQYITSKIGKIVEDIAWRGNTNDSGNLGKCDGWIKQISGDSATNEVTGYSDPSGTNLIDLIDDLVDNVDEDVREAEDLTLFVPRLYFDRLARAYRDQNFYAPMYHKEAEADGRYRLPTYDNITIAVSPGLNNSDFLCLTPASNLYFGTDLQNEFEDFRIHYSEDDDRVIERVKFKLAFNHAIGSEIAWADVS